MRIVGAEFFSPDVVSPDPVARRILNVMVVGDRQVVVKCKRIVKRVVVRIPDDQCGPTRHEEVGPCPPQHRMVLFEASNRLKS